MKSIIYLSLLTAALCLAQPAPLQADQPATIITAPAPNPYVIGQQSAPVALVQTTQRFLPPAPGTVAIVADATPRPPGPDVTTDNAVELDRARADVDQARAQLEQIVGATADPMMDRYHLWATTASPLGEPRALVIRSSETDAKTLAATEKDLNIMGRILDKALTSPEDGPHQAMGIRVYTFGNHSRVSNLQIEGYGAIFMLHVNFPLAGPASKSEEGADKEPSNSTWDEAEHEIYGPPPGSEGSRGASMPKEEYDPSRVEKLKSALLDALKNASHMRHLKSDENVMIVVSSGGGESDGNPFAYGDRLSAIVRTDMAGAGRPGYGGGTGGGGNIKGRVLEKNVYRGGGAKSTLTIRARKSDIDAFAGGKLGLKEFRNKVEMLVY